jgi:hypothetical protein
MSVRVIETGTVLALGRLDFAAYSPAGIRRRSG